MKTTILIILFTGISFAQIKSLSETELKNNLTKALIERLGFKQQAELSDSLVTENYRLNQKIWLQSYELKVCADEKFSLSQQLLNFECPKQFYFDTFFFGFVGAGIVALIAFIVGISI